MAVDLTPVLCGTFRTLEGTDGAFVSGSLVYESWNDCASQDFMLIDKATYRAIQAELGNSTPDTFFTDSSALWGLGLVAVVTVFAFKSILLRLFHFS